MLGLLPLTTGFGLPTRHTMCVFLRCRFHIGLGIVQVCPIIAFCLATSLLTPASSDYQFREKRRMKHGPGKWWRRFYGGVIGVFAIVRLQSTLTSMLRQKCLGPNRKPRTTQPKAMFVGKIDLHLVFLPPFEPPWVHHCQPYSSKLSAHSIRRHKN